MEVEIRSPEVKSLRERINQTLLIKRGLEIRSEPSKENKIHKNSEHQEI